jgi:hypothetical protein
VGYWRLSEPLGSVAFDSAGSDDGTYKAGAAPGVTGALTTTGDDGTSFDGTAGYVEVPDAAALNPTGAITVEAWCYPTDVSNRIVVAKRQTTPNVGYAWELAFATTGAAIARINANTNEARTATIYTANSWYHLAMTYDQSTIRLYVNGQQAATFAYTGAISTAAVPLSIGRRMDTGAAASFFVGTIDEVSVYNRALSASEIQAHYNAR